MSDCNHNCAECKHACASKKAEKLPANKGSRVQHVIGVVSGKGGVGKSLVSCLLAVSFAKMGYRTAILDADITGASIPHAFGLAGLKIEGDEFGMIPAASACGIKMISSNLLVENEDRPVILRGAAITATVKQFWTDCHWGDIDFMFIDMPPGTGDVPLSIYQSIPLDGIVMVGTPQALVSMIVKKAIGLAEKMNVKMLGLIENMSYVPCPDCGKRIYIYGNGDIEALAARAGCSVLAQLPIDPEISAAVDRGAIEGLDVSLLDNARDTILSRI